MGYNSWQEEKTELSGKLQFKTVIQNALKNYKNMP